MSLVHVFVGGLLLSGCAARAPGPTPPAPGASAQEAPSPAPAPAPSVPARLEALGLYPYPPPSKAGAAGQATGAWLKARPLLADEVAADFGNLDDLAWLGPIAREKSMFLFGEHHYLRVVHQLAMRVLFALNTHDHYGLLTLELPYSLTPFWDHYVGIRDDGEAERFFREEVAPTLIEKEQEDLLGHIRRWNRMHPRKRIHVAAHDIEHDFRRTITRVLVPYFKKLDPSFTIDPDTLDSKSFGVMLADLDQRLRRARAVRLEGAYPFIGPDYIGGVIENLRALWLGDRNDNQDHRGRAIIRNLTDPRYLGRFVRRHKVMHWGGSNHARTRGPKSGTAPSLVEGFYFSRDFGPTRNRTYSLGTLGFAVSLAEMASADPGRIRHPGSNYRDLLTKLLEGQRAGFVAPDGWYLPGAFRRSLGELIYEEARRTNHVPLLVEAIDWDSFARHTSLAPEDVRGSQTDFGHFDALVFIPRSPITRALAR
jgi:hypothetical protein